MKSIERVRMLAVAGVFIAGSISSDSRIVRELLVTSELGPNPVELYDPWGGPKGPQGPNTKAPDAILIPFALPPMRKPVIQET